MPMLRREDSLLAIIDVQERFYGALAPVDRKRLDLVAARCAWLAGLASALGVPVIVTEEDPARNGPTEAPIVARLPSGTPRFTKPVFGLADVPEILAAVEASGRRTVALAGMETDVCVAHSALGLLDRGYRVAVVTDATFSPGEMHEHGLRRMLDAGAEPLHAKGLLYEWVRTLQASRDLVAAHPELGEPPGFSL